MWVVNRSEIGDAETTLCCSNSFGKCRARVLEDIKASKLEKLSEEANFDHYNFSCEHMISAGVGSEAEVMYYFHVTDEL